MKRKPRTCTRITSHARKALERWFLSPLPAETLQKRLRSDLGSNQVTVIKVCQDPPIYVIDNFLTAGDVERLQEIVTQLKFHSSIVSDGIEDRVETYKTSTSAALPTDAKICLMLHNKIHSLIPNVKYEQPLQIVKYKPGASCEIHHDSVPIDPDSLELISDGFRGSMRVFTGFLYLNETKTREGCTYFPLLKLRVQPKPGRLLLFCNIVNDNLELDQHVIHVGETLTSGQKFGINIWFHNV